MPVNLRLPVYQLRISHISVECLVFDKTMISWSGHSKVGRQVWSLICCIQRKPAHFHVWTRLYVWLMALPSCIFAVCMHRPSHWPMWPISGHSRVRNFSRHAGYICSELCICTPGTGAPSAVSASCLTGCMTCNCKSAC